MTTSPLKLIEELQESGSLKVWSLIITFFGDAVEPRGGIVAASTLQSVMEVMGVGSGAVRTACSRLAKDGWIVRQKQGRNSFYRLSDMGHAPFRKASQQIYTAPPTRTAEPDTSPVSQSIKSAGKFTLLIQNPLKVSSNAWQSLRDKGIRINANSVLFKSDDPVLQNALDSALDNALETALENDLQVEDLLVLTDGSASFPDWIKRSVCNDDCAQRYRLLMRRFHSIPSNLPTDPLTSLAIRCLLIHEWRRLLLRSSPVPAELVPPDWPHRDCHLFVATLYRQLFDSGERWMDKNALGPNGQLKTSDQASQKRFLDCNS